MERKVCMYIVILMWASDSGGRGLPPRMEDVLNQMPYVEYRLDGDLSNN